MESQGRVFIIFIKSVPDKFSRVVVVESRDRGQTFIAWIF